jgi:hypothetical protein
MVDFLPARMVETDPTMNWLPKGSFARLNRRSRRLYGHGNPRDG